MKQVFLDSVSPEKAVECVNHMLDEHGPQSPASETVRVADSLGRVSAEPVFAKYSSPFYHSAAMDGYDTRDMDKVIYES